MATQQEMDNWLEHSNTLLQSFLPENSGTEIYGLDLPAGEFANLIDNEYLNVDQLLITMATTKDAEEAKAICSQLKSDTAVALFSRWAQYNLHWAHHPNPGHWVPLDSDEFWRAIFLAMKFDRSWSKDIAKQFLTQWFEELQD